MKEKKDKHVGSKRLTNFLQELQIKLAKKRAILSSDVNDIHEVRIKTLLSNKNNIKLLTYKEQITPNRRMLPVFDRNTTQVVNNKKKIIQGIRNSNQCTIL